MPFQWIATLSVASLDPFNDPIKYNITFQAKRGKSFTVYPSPVSHISPQWRLILPFTHPLRQIPVSTGNTSTFSGCLQVWEVLPQIHTELPFINLKSLWELPCQQKEYLGCWGFMKPSAYTDLSTTVSLFLVLYCPLSALLVPCPTHGLWTSNGELPFYPRCAFLWCSTEQTWLDPWVLQEHKQ